VFVFSKGSCFPWSGGEMGIRFYCPNGHRLNVKDFLAGKRGICPHCEARFRIPQASEIPQGSPRIQPGSAADNGHRGSPETRTAASSAKGNGALGNGALGNGALGNGALGNGALGNGALGNGKRQTASTVAVASTADTPIRESPEFIAIPVEVDSTVTSASLGRLAELSSPRGNQDAIDEVPDAIWYVRPRAGGQYGPAKGDVLRKWISEGRIAPDALVWREGWADWQLAGPVFPDLAGGYTTAAGAETRRETASLSFPAQPNVSERALNGVGRPARSRTARKKPVAAVVALVLLIVALCAGLAIVLTA
jgi:hypothetical protein